jgi:hypothetical protein
MPSCDLEKYLMTCRVTERSCPLLRRKYHAMAVAMTAAVRVNDTDPVTISGCNSAE